MTEGEMVEKTLTQIIDAARATDRETIRQLRARTSVLESERNAWRRRAEKQGEAILGMLDAWDDDGPELDDKVHAAIDHLREVMA